MPLVHRAAVFFWDLSQERIRIGEVEWPDPLIEFHAVSTWP